LSQQALSAELQKLKNELQQSALKAKESSPPASVKPKVDVKPLPEAKVERKVKAEPEPKVEVKAPAAPAPVAPATVTPAPAPAPAATAPMPQFQPAREKMLVYPRPNNE
jgi:hypothetical protein